MICAVTCAVICTERFAAICAARPRHILVALTALGGAALLVGCAAAPMSAPAPAPAPAAVAEPAPRSAPGRAAFELGQQRRAAEAERQGRLAEAAWAWEVLTLLNPERSDWLAQRQRVGELVQSRAAAALTQAQQDRQRGDLDRAVRGYLLVLSLLPEHGAAADALRSIERERNERQILGRLSRLTIPRSTLPEGSVQRAADAAATPETRNLAEHATLLAAQGEIDGAITLLSAPATLRAADPALKRLLADLYFKRAAELPATQPAQILAALRECLRLDPTHEGAAARLKELSAARR